MVSVEMKHGLRAGRSPIGEQGTKALTECFNQFHLIVRTYVNW